MKKYDDRAKTAGMYFPIDLEFGRYVLDDTKAKTYEDYDLLDDSDLETYLEWYEYVKGLYLESGKY